MHCVKFCGLGSGWTEMKSKISHIQLAVSCANQAQAENLVNHLLSERLVACGQIINKMKSFYHWEGQIAQSEECLLLLKTKAGLFEQIEQAITAHHSYDVPEITATALVAISEPYKKWIDEETI